MVTRIALVGPTVAIVAVTLIVKGIEMVDPRLIRATSLTCLVSTQRTAMIVVLGMTVQNAAYLLRKLRFLEIN